MKTNDLDDCTIVGKDFKNDEHEHEKIVITLAELNKTIKLAQEQGRLQAKQDFKENMLMFKSNHQLGCMLECYQSIIENRIGFEKEAKQLLEIASKLK